MAWVLAIWSKTILPTDILPTQLKFHDVTSVINGTTHLYEYENKVTEGKSEKVNRMNALNPKSCNYK